MHPRSHKQLRSPDYYKSSDPKLRRMGPQTAPPAGSGRFPPVKRTTAALASILALMLVAAPTALADNGVGLAGPTTDEIVTFFCFGVIAFFAVLVIGLSLLQNKLEKRKDRRRSDLERLS